MAATRRTRYVSPDGTTIILEVPEPPMGHGSGYIPPPGITYWREHQPTTFVYAGDE